MIGEETPMRFWVILLGMGILTYVLRVSPIVVLARFEIPDFVRRALRFVPPAVLSALVLPALLAPTGTIDLAVGNVRMLAGAFAVAVAWRTRNTLLTIAAGMVAMWLLRALLT